MTYSSGGVRANSRTRSTVFERRSSHRTEGIGLWSEEAPQNARVVQIVLITADTADWVKADRFQSGAIHRLSTSMDSRIRDEAPT